MAPFSGSLQSKKKADLQNIANSLGISDTGTKDELQLRIKKHLDNNQEVLEGDPQYAGLYGIRSRGGAVARKPSLQPQLPSSRLAPPKEPSPPSPRKPVPMDPIVETPERGEVSVMLKSITPFATKIRTVVEPPTPSSLPPLPSSSDSISAIISAPKGLSAMVIRRVKEVNKGETLVKTRSWMSNSANIWLLSALVEFLVLLAVIVPWMWIAIGGIEVPYPTVSVFRSRAFWMDIGRWAGPTVVIPGLVGYLVSFRGRDGFDPLTGWVVRLAGVVLAEDARWRVVTASVGVAFAFAEAMPAPAPVFNESQKRLTAGNTESEEVD
ncbi:uncharacterized protein BT62DRAFT_931131 [Guyanagaster necrorhizus]|uniref:SAP domain-containing protein n=1 Tax=Guyanagaster necrorhizus TaxID=856835 RepID=A0A9P7VUV0_9AGAR|nr:uncharacterized protein BT62DRAFT_931131 [Guyanagaster necrorhizus MCA 3950]KAG7447287.1 hypothetical protein BT62DRAFT_931131 [Guyanagaster necrorhizus MCA 3950]